MQTLSTNQRRIVFSASHLSDQQRALVPAFDSSSFDAVTVDTGQGPFRNSVTAGHRPIATGRQYEARILLESPEA